MDFSTLCGNFYAYAKQNGLTPEELSAKILSVEKPDDDEIKGEKGGDNFRFSSQERFCESGDGCRKPDCPKKHPIPSHIDKMRIDGKMPPSILLRGISKAMYELEECPDGMSCSNRYPGTCLRYHAEEKSLVSWRSLKERKRQEEDRRIEERVQEEIRAMMESRENEYSASVSRKQMLKY